MITHRETEIQHDGRLLTLVETARMNNLSLNPDKIQFKSTDCKFFRHRLTPEGLKLDPEKVKAIVQMPPSQYPESTKFQWHGKLPKEIQSSLDRISRAPKKTTEMRHNLGLGV